MGRNDVGVTGLYPNASLDGGLAIAVPQDLKVGCCLFRKAAVETSLSTMHTWNLVFLEACPVSFQGLEIAWQRFGRLPWSMLVEPAAKIARMGFPMHPYLQYILSGPFTLKRAQVIQYLCLRPHRELSPFCRAFIAMSFFSQPAPGLSVLPIACRQIL